MKFDSLQVGMTVYDVHSEKLGNTTLRTVGCWDVKIVSIDTARQEVVASWNGNAPRKYYGRSIAKWRKTKPMMIRSPMGRCRLATREEIKAAKAQA